MISIHALLAESDSICLHSDPVWYRFLSTLSLRRATPAPVPRRPHADISIHALLAESDPKTKPLSCIWKGFYPRSPCGERRPSIMYAGTGPVFLSTLSLRRATITAGPGTMTLPSFYPRSPCGERHAPLMEALDAQMGFYPRSPCGERLIAFKHPAGLICVSIHALLAESDLERLGLKDQKVMFLSTLSLRRATL